MFIRIQYTQEGVLVRNVNSIEVEIYHTVTHSFRVNISIEAKT